MEWLRQASTAFSDIPQSFTDQFSSWLPQTDATEFTEDKTENSNRTLILWLCLGLGLIIFLTSLFVWFLIPKGEPCYSSFPPDRFYPFVRGKDTRHDLEIIRYFCNDEPQAPVFEIWECEDDWKLVSTDKCECYEPPPVPITPNVYDWDGKSLHIGVEVKYYCLPSFHHVFRANINNEPFEIIHCTNNKTWAVTMKNDFCDNLTALCFDDPPEGHENSVQEWNKQWYRVGTIIPYYCTERKEKIHKVVVCDMEVKWTEIFSQECDCTSDPPLPTIGIYREWDGSRRLGNVAVYLCAAHLNSTVLLSYMCDGSQWKQVYRGSCAIKNSCSQVPPMPLKRGFVRGLGTTQQFGSLLVYYCDKESMKIYQTTLCTNKNEWEVIHQNTCIDDCPDESLPSVDDHNSRFVIGRSSNELGSNKIDSCIENGVLANLSTFSRSFVCDRGTWRQMTAKMCTRSLPFKECPEDVPDGPEGTVLHWPSRNRLLGSSIRYLCMRNELSVVAATFICNDWGKWIQIQNLSCLCTTRPPLPRSILYRVIKPKVNSIGSKITVYCNYEPGSPIFWIVSCTHLLTWEVYELNRCFCTQPPDDEYPVTYRKNYKTSMYHLGTKVNYSCTPHPKSPVTLVLECVSFPVNKDGKSNGTYWNNIYEAPCPTTPHVCYMDPNYPPKFVDWDQEENRVYYVGTIITYFCHADRSRVLMTSLCTSQGVWKETHTPESCGCLLDPPLATRNILRNWDGNLKFGSRAYYMCKLTDDERILRTLVCAANGSWIEVFRGSCRPKDYSSYKSCKEEKLFGDLSLWKNSNISGATITIWCPQNISSRRQTVHKVYVCDPVTRRWKLVTEASCPCDEPSTIAPQVRSSKLMMLWNGFRTEGTIVKYVCYPSLMKAHSPRLITQCIKSKWIKIYEGACGCFSVPDKPNQLSLRLWDRTHNVGSNVTFLCSNDKYAPVEQTYTCYGNGQWVPLHQKPRHCECKFPPEPRYPVVWDWNGKNLHMGKIITYRCNNDRRSPQVVAIKCTAHLKWTILSIFNWTKELVRFKPRATYSHYHVISGIVPIPAKGGRLDLGKLSTICKGLITPGNEFNPDWNRLTECRCDCLDDPPVFEEPVFHDWKQVGALSRYYGTEITYWCSPNTQVYIKIKCFEDRLWRPIDKKARNTCKCSQEPPDIYQYQDYPIDREWPERSHHLSSKVNHRCSSIPNSPIIMQYECVFRHETKRNEWIKTLDRGISVCVCQGDLPKPPKRVPKLKIVPQWTYGADNMDLVMWIGSLFDYHCSDDVMAGVYQVVECNVDATWQITFFTGHCKECQGDPPTGPGVRNWDGSRVIGTIVPYQCSEDVNSLHLMDYQCSREKLEWELIYSGSCDCKGFPETAPHPLKLQVDWLSPASRHMGVKHKVTCVSDEASPVVDIIMCSSDGQWKRNSTSKWIKLLKENCLCPVAPYMAPYYMSDPPTTNYFIGDTITYRCAREKRASARKIIQCSNEKAWIELLDNPLACSCLGNPPPAEGKEFRDWSGNRDVGTEIFYRCRIHSPFVSKTAKCTSDSEWTVTYTEEAACSCVENEPVLPAGTDETDVRFVHDVGAKGTTAIAQYHCNAYNSSPIFAEINCGRDGQWEVVKPENLIGNAIDDAFWNRTFKDACFCKDEVGLPVFDQSLNVHTIEPSQRVMGSEIIYLCNANDHSRFLRKFECNYNKKWAEVDTSDVNRCICKEDPPLPPKFSSVTRIWTGTRDYGTKVIYWCTEEEKTIFQIIKCGVNGTWEYSMPPDPYGSCDCPEPPKEIRHRRRDWNGNNSTGSLVTFYCTDNINDNVLYNRAYLVYECSAMRRWKKVMNLNCTCPGKLPKWTGLKLHFDHDHTLNSSVGAMVHARCSTVKHSPVVTVYTCGHNVTWELTPKIKDIIKKTCECPTDLPPILPVIPAHSRDWNESHRIGTKIFYHCTTKDSPMFEMYYCSLNKTWTKNSTLDDLYLYQIRCHCSAPPPVSTDVPTVVRPPEVSFTVGSKFADLCNSEKDSAKHIEYECSVNRTWKISLITNCTCNTLPSFFPKTIYADWGNPSQINDTLTYSCSSRGGFVASFVCTKSLTWSMVKSVVVDDDDGYDEYINENCICTSKPPRLAPPFYFSTMKGQRKWRSGDKIPILCKKNSTNNVSWYECTVQKWIIGIPLNPLMCQCKRSEAPKPSLPYFLKTDDELIAVGSDLIYYCFDNPPFIFKMVLHCSNTKTWISKLDEQNCTCKPDTLFGIPKEFVLNNTDEEYAIGRPISIFCSGFKHPFPVQRIWCTQEKKWIKESDFSWEQLIANRCECPEPPAPPAGVLIKPRKYSKKLGSVVWHQCSTSLGDGFDNVFTCEENPQSESPTWTLTNNGTCECSGPPPGSETNDWDNKQYKVGTVVRFFCRESVDTPVKYTVTCKRKDAASPLEWQRSEDNICECREKPILPPTENFHLHFLEGNLIGSVAKLTCSKHPLSPPVRLFRCSVNGTWEVDDSVRNDIGELCMCPIFENPHPDLSLRYISDDPQERRFVGSNIFVLCTEGYAPYLEKHHCNVNRTWEKVEDGVCECPPLPTLPAPQIIVINQKSENPLSIGQTHPIICNEKNPKQVHNHIICSPEKKWVYEHEHMCVCTSPPPLPTTAKLTLQWNMQQLIGTIANYTCMNLRTSPVVISVKCSINDKWVMSPNAASQEALAEEECTCYGDPPPAQTHLNRVWSEDLIYMGDEARYECSTGSIDYVYRCNVNRQWERIHMGFCECKTDLPVLTPATAIVTSRYRGAVVHFLCTADPENGLYRDYRCSEDDRWELVREYSCVCEDSAPIAPPQFYSFSENVVSGSSAMYVGSETKYFCSNLSDSRIIRRAVCVSQSPRDPKIWMFDDNNNTDWDYHSKQCECKVDPPLPYLNAGWDWDGQTYHEGHVVNYYCTDNNTTMDVIASAICNEKHKWEMNHKQEWHELLKEKCICGEPPKISVLGAHWSWETPVHYRVGSIVVHWCDEHKVGFHVKYQCNRLKDWEVIELGTCDKDFCSIRHHTGVSCLHFSFSPQMFRDAKLTCKMKGKTIIQIKNEETTEKIIKCAFPAPASCKNFYFGINFSNRTGEWIETRTERPITYSNWTRKRKSRENCATIDFNGKWRPVSCASSHCVLCESPAENNLYFKCRKVSDRLPDI